MDKLAHLSDSGKNKYFRPRIRTLDSATPRHIRRPLSVPSPESQQNLAEVFAPDALRQMLIGQCRLLALREERGIPLGQNSIENLYRVCATLLRLELTP